MANDRKVFSRQLLGVSQGNYDDYVLPEALEVMGNVSLYIAVAYWGLLLKRPFYRDEVASVFKIGQRRAADVISYIVRRRQDVIQSKIHYEGVVGRRRRYILIVSIKHECIYPERRRDELVDSDNAENSINEMGVQQFRQWFLRSATLSK